MALRRDFWSRKMIPAFYPFLVIGILMSPLAVRAQARKNADFLRQFSNSLEEITEKVSPAVVQVIVTGYGPVEKQGHNNAALIGLQRVTGSGVIVDPEGYIITNAHVVSGAQRIQVLLTSPNETAPPAPVAAARTRSLNAQIVGVDKQIDLALLKADAGGLQTLSFAEYKNIRQGQFVLAFGSPEGLENTVTAGVISSIARQPLPDHPLFYIQTDAPINPGNSGGPLVDVDGRVVGLNTFIMTQGGGSEGIGFAIPSSIVDHVYRQLKQFGHVHRKVVGASVQPITRGLSSALSLPRDHGLIIADVLPDGPAETAGLMIQDIVLSVDSRPMQSLPEFESFLFLHESGEKLKLEILRGKEHKTLEIPVLDRREEEDQLNDLVNQNNLIPQLGIMGVTINDKIIRILDELRINSGVLIAALTESSGAEEIGLTTGDIIHSVNGVPVESLEALRTALGNIKPGSSVALQVEIDGQLEFVEFEIN
jgi:serine protease Do